ncbi:hypothetical protein ACFO5Q_12655 [Kordiimonas lipolytica]|uniref:DUF2523 domain-containing protein n=1 Tax=Kordiimonas lipolytica TaxID=1662421 RepID=A0ABV8UBY4_9PROT|nr:hypothetical protein [Kordiimonas lipolytica]
MSIVFGAFFTVGVPVAVTAYLLIGWLIHNGRLQSFSSRKELDEHIKGIKQQKKERKKEQKKKKEAREKESDLAFRKWLQFGGGFYGTAALYTFVINEIGDIFRFLFKVLNIADWQIDWSLGGIINFLVTAFVEFLLNSLQNFLAAILWFMEWGEGDGGLRILMNFAMAYVGYGIGSRLASEHATTDNGHRHLWRWIESKRNRGEQQEIIEEET